ncbi:sensor histidine kinase [Actinomadura soli]|uniref:histidine kinase n=1 Tax=Actinomadura soli TaxID=2508997 RepID=A0A5C4J853_9ACTN|nr:histidine kinase [Actinomadura soli]TMQ95075.1 sensor histidine kinase [Actinomadura soli]
MEYARRFPGGARAADLLLCLAITAPLLLPDHDGFAPTGLPLGWMRIAAAPLLALAVLISRRRPVAAAAVPAALGLAASPELHTAVGFAVAQVTLAFLLGHRAADRPPALWLFAGVLGAGGLALLAAPDADFEDGGTLVANVLLVFVLPWLAGQGMRQRAELDRAGWQLAERLERERHLVVHQARLRERARIATDMHDSLGHDLALIAVRAGGLKVAADTSPQGREAAEELRRSAAAAARRLHEVIQVLREGDETAPLRPAGESVAVLVHNAKASGIPVTLDDLLSDGDALPPMTERAIFRVVQEALTNAAKHAEGAPITVTMSRDGRNAVVTVTNDAPAVGTTPPVPPQNANGHGLIGLDERVRQAGGTLHAHPTAKGFTVTAHLPLSAGAPATPPRAASTTREHAATTRRTARRRALHTIGLPTAGITVLLLFMALNDHGTDSSLLEKHKYNELRIGESQQVVEDRLPARQLRPEHRPARPNGADECRYYGTDPDSFTPAYQLCFTAGRLSHKDKVVLSRVG